VTRPEAVLFRADPHGDAVVGSAHREGPVVTLRARYDDGREIVSAHTGLAPPTPGTRVTVEISPGGVVEVPTASGAGPLPPADAAAD
jgi:hypothetical protein